MKGFAAAWFYAFGYALDVPVKANAFSIYMAYWFPDINPNAWITIFIILPVLFNLLNVRKYGEIEFFFTVIKVLTIFGAIIVGFVIVAGGTGKEPLLGTSNGKPVPCGNSTDCLPLPGFRCMSQFSLLK